MTDNLVWTAILLGALVTWIPRIAPFILTKYKSLPPVLVRFLNYLPMTIIFTLTLASILDSQPGRLPQLKWIEASAVLPTFWVVAKSRNILLGVVTGITVIALLRLIF